MMPRNATSLDARLPADLHGLAADIRDHIAARRAELPHHAKAGDAAHLLESIRLATIAATAVARCLAWLFSERDATSGQGVPGSDVLDPLHGNPMSEVEAAVAGVDDEDVARLVERAAALVARCRSVFQVADQARKDAEEILS